MTAEVAILNKHGIALAADSAVTTGDLKIFNTVNKVFALNKTQPVGIMVYNAADIMGVPVETVIKEFRRKCCPKTCEHLEGYAEAFEAFLKADTSLFSEEARTGSLSAIAESLVQQMREEACWKLNAAGWKGWGHPSAGEAKRALTGTIAEHERRIEKTAAIQVDEQPEKERLVAAEVGSRLDEQIRLLGQLFSLDAPLETRICSLILKHFFSEAKCGGETGFVIAGFGTKDVFPRLRAFEFQCSALRLHKMVSRYSIDISDQIISQIHPFGQKDVMATFVEGIDPVYKLFLSEFISNYFRQKGKELKSGIPPRPTEARLFSAIGTELAREFARGLDELVWAQFVQPTVHVVASMPKEELAILAEALINLTALKRKASRDAETVGGPTDVAVISKGDGLIWIKRKHYFDSELNPLFAQRWLQDNDS